MKYFLIFILLISSIGFAKDICINEKEIDKIIKQLEDDKKALQEDDAKWAAVRKETPDISYKVDKVNNNLIIEKIRINVPNDNPLEYSTNFSITQRKEGWFPFELRLIGSVEFGIAYFSPDVKLGLKFFGFSPVKIPFLSDLGINAVAGVKSFGIGISYDLPKPFKNSSLMFYSGYTYTLKQTYGAGFALNF